MFKRNTGTHSTNSAVAAAVAAMAGVGGVPAGGVSGEEDPIPVNSRSNNGGGCGGGRTVARFELKMAPRHVIPDQYKEDILKNAFKNFEDSQSKDE